MINSININYNYPHKNLQSNHSPAFGNKISLPKKKAFVLREKAFKAVEYPLRLVLNKAHEVFAHKSIDARYKKLMSIKEGSEEYLETLFGLGEMCSRKKAVEINVESQRIKDIAKSNDSCIFIMNHDNQKKDPALLTYFHALLAREYISNDKIADAPAIRVIMNEAILTTKNNKSRAIMEKLGSVGIDASLFGADSKKNARKLLPTIKEFVNNKTHLYIFPEGKMCAFKNLDLEYKFQTGIAETISKLTGAKKSVKVVPLGFAYNPKDKELLGSIHVGEPVYFKKQGQNILATKGNTDSPFASKAYANFFKKPNIDNDGFNVITKEGVPVNGKDLPDYIAGILCENLKICREEAKKAIDPTLIKGTPEASYVPLYIEPEIPEILAFKPKSKSLSPLIYNPMLSVSFPLVTKICQLFPNSNKCQNLFENLLIYCEKAVEKSNYSKNKNISSIEKSFTKKGVNVRFNNVETAQFVKNGFVDIAKAGYELPKNILMVNPLTIKRAGGAATIFSDEKAAIAPILLPKNIVKLSQKKIKTKNEQGFYSTNNPSYYIHHEVGHWLHFQNKPDYDTCREIWNNADKKLVKNEVSKNALKTDDGTEFVAEVFAGLIDGKQYNSTIINLYKQLKGP